MGGGELQPADVVEHLGGISFVYFMLILERRETGIRAKLMNVSTTTPSFTFKGCLAGLASEELLIRFFSSLSFMLQKY